MKDSENEPRSRTVTGLLKRKFGEEEQILAKNASISACHDNNSDHAPTVESQVLPPAITIKDEIPVD